MAAGGSPGLVADAAAVAVAPHAVIDTLLQLPVPAVLLIRSDLLLPLGDGAPTQSFTVPLHLTRGGDGGGGDSARKPQPCRVGAGRAGQAAKVKRTRGSFLDRPSCLSTHSWPKLYTDQ